MNESESKLREISSIFSGFADSKSSNTDIYKIIDKEELTENRSEHIKKLLVITFSENLGLQLVSFGNLESENDFSIYMCYRVLRPIVRRWYLGL